jgi:hypothetical protein
MKKLMTFASATILTAFASTLLLTGCAASREPFAGSCESVSNDAEKIYAKLSILENSKSLTYLEQLDDIWAAGYRTAPDYFESFDSDINMINILVGADDEFRASFTEGELLVLDDLREETDYLSVAFNNGSMAESYDKVARGVQAILEACNR